MWYRASKILFLALNSTVQYLTHMTCWITYLSYWFFLVLIPRIDIFFSLRASEDGSPSLLSRYICIVVREDKSLFSHDSPFFAFLLKVPFRHRKQAPTVCNWGSFSLFFSWRVWGWGGIRLSPWQMRDENRLGGGVLLLCVTSNLNTWKGLLGGKQWWGENWRISCLLCAVLNSLALHCFKYT